jgi:hypothetical protein
VCRDRYLIIAVAQLVEVLPKKRKISGSIPDGVIGFFIDLILSTQRIREMSTWGGGCGKGRLSRNSGSLKILESEEPVQAFISIALPVHSKYQSISNSLCGVTQNFVMLRQAVVSLYI